MYIFSGGSACPVTILAYHSSCCGSVSRDINDKKHNEDPLTWHVSWYETMTNAKDGRLVNNYGMDVGMECGLGLEGKPSHPQTYSNKNDGKRNLKQQPDCEPSSV